MKRELDAAIHDFFDTAGIDSDTGIVTDDPHAGTRRFGSMPYIGSRYAEAPLRILFLGYDIGRDPGKIESFEERRRAIEDADPCKLNPHISGTYASAVFWLRDALDLDDAWDAIQEQGSISHHGLQPVDGLPDVNPLAYVALRNMYPFVSLGREERSGGQDQQLLFPEQELALLRREIAILDPDVIICQGKQISRDIQPILDDITDGRTVLHGYHPRYGSHLPDNPDISQIERFVTECKSEDWQDFDWEISTQDYQITLSGVA
jgi:hypothetical protein